MIARLTFSNVKSRLYINVEWTSLHVVRYQFFISFLYYQLFFLATRV